VYLFHISVLEEKSHDAQHVVAVRAFHYYFIVATAQIVLLDKQFALFWSNFCEIRRYRGKL